MIRSIFSRSALYFYIALALVMGLSLSGFVYFYKLGVLDNSKDQSLHRVSFILENFDKKSPISEVRDFVFQENNKLALNGLDRLEENLKEVNSVLQDDDFSYVANEHSQVKSQVAALVSFTNSDKVLEILREKIMKFSLYVDEKNWKTLSRSANRLTGITKGYIDKNKLTELSRKISSELENMRETTKESVLQPSDKEAILSKVNSFRPELEMLQKYSERKAAFAGTNQAYGETFKSMDRENLSSSS